MNVTLSRCDGFIVQNFVRKVKESCSKWHYSFFSKRGGGNKVKSNDCANTDFFPIIEVYYLVVGLLHDMVRAILYLYL